MRTKTSKAVREALNRAISIEQEVEASGEATLDEHRVAQAKQHMREWIESVVGYVCSPGTGRVMLIHADGHESSISSPDLPFLLSRPADWTGDRMH